jgi:hypothetical protein
MFRHSMCSLLVSLCALTAASQAATATATGTAVAYAVTADQHRATRTVARALNAQTLSDLATAMKGEAYAYAS